MFGYLFCKCHKLAAYVHKRFDGDGEGLVYGLCEFGRAKGNKKTASVWFETVLDDVLQLY
jgi:hypothetical protein